MCTISTAAITTATEIIFHFSINLIFRTKILQMKLLGKKQQYHSSTHVLTLNFYRILTRIQVLYSLFYTYRFFYNLNNYYTWYTGSQSDKRDCSDRILQSNCTSEAGSQITNECSEYTNHDNGDVETSPATPVICKHRVAQ